MGSRGFGEHMRCRGASSKPKQQRHKEGGRNMRSSSRRRIARAVVAITATAGFLVWTAVALSQEAAAPISGAKAIVRQYEGPAKYVPAGKPFDALKVAKGKTIGWVSVTTAIPFTQSMLKGARAAAKVLGMTIVVCDGKGQVSEWARCYQQFISRKVDVIVSQSIDPRILKGPITDANKAGIPVNTTSSNFSEAKTLWPGTSAENAQPFRLVSRLMGDYAVADSNGKANVLVITSNEVYVAPGQAAAITGELKKYCPSTCKWKVVNVPISDWNTRIPTVVQSEIRANPNLNYVIPLYDGEVPAAIQGVNAANAGGKVKVISFNALPGIMDFMKKRRGLVADVGVDVLQHGWATIDQAARVLAGEKGTSALRDPKLAVRLFDLANVDTLNFKNPDTWYGKVSLAAFYKKQWMIK
jgi:ribose transport system substrate-binding protein